MPRLLLIDDDDSVRKVMRFRLQDSYEIIDTGSPEEALGLALQEKPDAILLDLMMPKFSGFEVCQTLSSLSFTQDIPILILSGESSAQYKEFCESLGAKGYFQKPVDMALLQETLARLIEAGSKKGRSEPRVRLRITLKLRSANDAGGPAELMTVTENVTANGFLCGYQGAAKEGSVVDVHMGSNGRQFAGKARIVRVDWAGTPGQRCDFQFLEKPVDWILH